MNKSQKKKKRCERPVCKDQGITNKIKRLLSHQANQPKKLLAQQPSTSHFQKSSHCSTGLSVKKSKAFARRDTAPPVLGSAKRAVRWVCGVVGLWGLAFRIQQGLVFQSGSVLKNGWQRFLLVVYGFLFYVLV